MRLNKEAVKMAVQNPDIAEALIAHLADRVEMISMVADESIHPQLVVAWPVAVTPEVHEKFLAFAREVARGMLELMDEVEAFDTAEGDCACGEDHSKPSNPFGINLN